MSTLTKELIGNQETPLKMPKEVMGTQKKLPKDVMGTSEKAPVKLHVSHTDPANIGAR